MNAITRAFGKIPVINPSGVRSSQGNLIIYNRVSFPLGVIGTEKMNYQIVEKPSFKIVGKSKRFEFEDFAKNGKKFWKEYVASDEYKTLCQISHGKPGLISGAPLLTAYYPKEKNKLNEFLDVFGIESNADSRMDQFEIHTVPSATYAEFECSYKAAMKTNRYIYGEWFSETGYERDGDKPDVVAYFQMPYQSFSQMSIRWWIPVVKKM